MNNEELTASEYTLDLLNVIGNEIQKLNDEMERMEKKKEDNTTEYEAYSDLEAAYCKMRAEATRVLRNLNKN